MRIKSYDEGQAAMLEKILLILDELEDKYYDARASSQLGLHPIKEAKRIIIKETD